MEKVDVLIVGAGPGGLAAAKGAKAAGAERVVILERDSRAGGILNQCVHDGFGLVRYKQQLTGPEYAVIAEKEAADAGAELLCGHHVVSIEAAGGGDFGAHETAGTGTFGAHETAGTESFCAHEVVAIGADGLRRFHAKAIVMATGCRERTRGAIAIPGSRPAGVFTAGVMQNFVNVRNIMPGKRVVILGSGDVGMIMARRLTLEGAKVEAVIEVLPEPAGLSRNVSQCLYDYDIPIYCSHTVSKIIGKKKLEAIEMSELDTDGKVVAGTGRIIECDALVLSVGLIPENEVAQTAGVDLDVRTNGVITDSHMQTNVPGIFSCGNSRRIMDLADFVSEQGELAGRNAVAYINGQEMQSWDEARSSSMAKGFPDAGVVTCTLCPKGCQVRFNSDTGKYEGNGCKRGIEFAEQERLDPKRFLTTTVRVGSTSESAAMGDFGPGRGAKLLPVRSEAPISLNRLAAAVEELRSVTVVPPIECGDVVARIDDGSGNMVSILAGSSVKTSTF